MYTFRHQGTYYTFGMSGIKPHINLQFSFEEAYFLSTN